MFKKILKELSISKAISYKITAKKLGINVEILKDLLFDMERRKYIEAEEYCSSTESCNNCGHCPSSMFINIKTWKLTEKGKKAIS